MPYATRTRTQIHTNRHTYPTLAVLALTCQRSFQLKAAKQAEEQAVSDTDSLALS